MSTTTDVLIIGGGSGAAAIRSAELGRSVILVEANDLGGTCLHRGFIPTKALLHAAEVADSARTAGQFGVDTELTGINGHKVYDYQQSVVERLHKGLKGLILSHGIDVIHGSGYLVDDHAVKVNDKVLTAANIVIATGSKPRLPHGVTTGGRVLTSDDALALTSIPNKVIILGGGVIGVEFASIWASFGADVTIIEALPRLVHNEDAEISKHLERAFRRRRIKMKTRTSVTEVSETVDSVTVTTDSGEVLSADFVLAATGRIPNTGGVGLEQAGIQLDRGFVATNGRLQTTLTNIYAVGDVVAGPQLAHRGFQHGIFVAEDLAGGAPEVMDDTIIPRVTYSKPEIASVGLSEASARETLTGTVGTFTYDLAGNGKSQILKTAGVVKTVTHNGAIVGIHIVGDRAGELIGEAQLLVGFGVKPSEAARFVHAHPTQGEAIGEAMLALAGKPLHVHA